MGKKATAEEVKIRCLGGGSNSLADGGLLSLSLRGFCQRFRVA